MATTTATPWQAQIIEELDAETISAGIPHDHTHAAVWIPDENELALPELLGTAESEIAAVVIAEDKGATLEGGEARVVKLDDLAKWSAADAAGHPEPELDGPTIEPRRRNVEEGEPAEVIEHPEEEGEPQPDELDDDGEPLEPAAPLVEDGGQVTAFDKDGYIPEPLQLPKVDGEGIDKIAAKFGGRFFMDRSAAADCKLVRDSKLGSTVTLMVECEVGPPVPGYTTNKEGDLDALALTRVFKVISVYRPAAEEL